MADIPDDVIIPPPSIRAIVLKTAQYVARNGAEFEERIRQQPQSTKFSFLDPTDAYNGYYKYLTEHPELLEDTDDSTDKQPTKEVQPVPELDFLVSMPVITTKDLEIIKLTAQFVSVNGVDYKQAIRNKYKDQALQFAFLEPGHSLNPLFETYLAQYTKIQSGELDVVPVYELLERAYKRAEWEFSQRDKREKVERAEEEEKLRFARVDWNDFVIVETIEFTEVDGVTELDLPVTIEQLQLRSLDEKSKQVTEIKEVPVSATQGMKIREFGATRLKSVKKRTMLQCPITGKMIPEENFQRHIEILLRDPKYQEEKKKYEAKIQGSTELTPEEVAENLKSLFQGKTEQNKRQKVLWDGYQSSADYVKAKSKASAEEVEEYKRKQREPVIGPTKP